MIALILCWSVPTWAATVGQDLFTEASGTPQLDAHTPDVGAGWTAEQATEVLVSSTTDGVFTSTDTLWMARKGDNIGSDEMDCTVSARVESTPSTRIAGVCARMTTADFANAFCAFLLPDGTTVDVRLTKEVGGTVTTLATFDANLAAGTDHTLKLKVRDNGAAVDLKVDVNATPDAISVTESTNPLAGNNYCGLLVRSNNTSTIRINDFLSESVTVAATRRNATIFFP